MANRGGVKVSRGNLATAVGWPANIDFDVAVEPEDLPLSRMEQNTKELIHLALQHRPDLSSARATVRQGKADLEKAESDLWPKLIAKGNAAWTGIDARVSGSYGVFDGDIDSSDIFYYGGLALQFPIFEGFSLRNKVRVAGSNLKAARAALRVKEEKVISEVWSSFYNVRTAAQQVETSKTLLASSTESYRVSLARYRAGAAEIVELLNAQSLLVSARSQEVQARTDLFTYYAELVHAIGADLPSAVPDNLSGLLMLLCLVFLLPGGCKKKQKAPPASAPPEVTITEVVLKTVPVRINYVSTTESVMKEEIRARVEGFLEERRFKEGDDIKKGDLVYVIERAPFQAELEGSLAQLAKDKAALAFALEQVKRYAPLAEKDFVTQEAFDDYQTKAKEAAASVKADRAKIKQDRLNLGYCTMYSPIDGRIGRTLVNVGNLVGAGGQNTHLATIVQLDPIYVYFSPSVEEVYTILKFNKKGTPSVDLILSDGSVYPYPGKVDFIDNTANPETNTVNMRAVVPNPEKMLLPGIYVQARLFLCELPDTPLIPEQAVAEDQGGMYVLVVGKDNKVEHRKVNSRWTYEGQQIIEKGLKEGEKVITAGMQMVRPGMVVNPKLASDKKGQKTESEKGDKEVSQESSKDGQKEKKSE
ncbi:MAG: efflux RND transporter periplasmic adaptor subunit [Deltaproteobacteria bacterium]|nr:efflux RND transporter periplasmic adaptor subunit [Deltaproteobacteria bacterium]